MNYNLNILGGIQNDKTFDTKSIAEEKLDKLIIENGFTLEKVNLLKYGQDVEKATRKEMLLKFKEMILEHSTCTKYHNSNKYSCLDVCFEKIIKELGNPWGNDFFLAYKYTRNHHMMSFDDALYKVYWKG